VHRLLDKLKPQARASLDRLISKITAAHAAERGQRVLDCLEGWLLDDEQRDVLGLHGWNIYFLYAAAHLYTPAADSADSLIERWSFMDGEDAAMTDILARICYLAAGGYENDRTIDGAEKQDYAGAPVNVALVATAIQIAAALDLQHPDTARTIAAGLSAEGDMPLAEFCKNYAVQFAGPHAYAPGTIQVKIQCTHPEVHRALKHHESKLQNLLH